MYCKFNDCGHCYSKNIEANSVFGECRDSANCKVFITPNQFKLKKENDLRDNLKKADDFVRDIHSISDDLASL